MNLNSPSSSSWQESLDSFSPEIADNGGSGGGQWQRKRRLKLIQLSAASKSAAIPTDELKARIARKKPDASAAKITRPCSECGRQFWSWKALFGHMRCHPERQWRGINPPPNFQRTVSTGAPSSSPLLQLTEEDNEIATCLLMLANGGSALGNLAVEPSAMPCVGMASSKPLDSQIMCSSCRRMLGSHQKKGDFSISMKDDGEDNGNENSRVEEGEGRENEEEKMVMILGHKCSVCLKVFSSGQALGGRRRCNWEKADEHDASTSSATRVCGLDLNLPAPHENEDGGLFF